VFVCFCVFLSDFLNVGCSWVFGYSAIAEFLDQLNLVSVIRAHEVQKVRQMFCVLFLGIESECRLVSKSIGF
jgi:hypothetical protein